MGYSIALFVDQDAVRGLKCGLCHDVMQDAVRTTCGHLFCQQCCVGRILNGTAAAAATATPNTGGTPTCPVCQHSFTNADDRLITEDTATRDTISKLGVRCQNAGCTWLGELKSYTNHVSDGCAFVRIQCPNFPCSAVVPGKLFQHHLSVCEYKPVMCQYCKSSVSINDRQSHLSLCPDVLCSCEYQGFGCLEMVKRKDMAEHMRCSNEKHLMLVIAKSINTIQIERQTLHAQQLEISRLTSEHEQQSKVLISQRKELEDLRRTVATYLRAIPRSLS